MGSLRVGHNCATSLSRIGEGNGNPIQCSCLKNPRGTGAWWAAVSGVAQSRTRLKRLSSSSSSKGTFHAKMGSIKDRNGIDLTEAEDIKKRWQEYTEELYKKDLQNPDNHIGVITHLEPDILECEVKWALGSITTNKASGGDGISVELFQILKDDAVKVLHSICQAANLENSAVATGLEKLCFHSSPKERQCQRMLKLPHNCTHLTC